jgi:iron(III) transport system substrate-binding protein
MRFMAAVLRCSILVLLALLIFVGCRKPLPQSHVVVYTALEPDETDKMVAEFEAGHPDIKLDVVHESTEAITAKLLAEAANPQADAVWALDITSLLLADDKGLLEPYKPVGTDQVSEEFKDTRKVPHWVGVDACMTALVINTVEIAKSNVPRPQSYTDLIKPIYRDMITMPDPDKSSAGFLTVSGIMQYMGEDAGWIYLEQLNQNIAAYTATASAPVDMAGTGEHAIGISFDFRAMEAKTADGPLEIVFPKERSGWEMQANALVQKPNINPSAKIFLDWAISAPAFKEYGQHFILLSNPAYMHPPDGFPMHPKDVMIKNDFSWASQNRGKILAEWSRRFGSKSK